MRTNCEGWQARVRRAARIGVAGPFVVAVALVGGCGGGEAASSTQTVTVTAPAVTVSGPAVTVTAPAVTVTAPAEGTATTAEAPLESPDETVSQENARETAESYLDSQAFSKKGLTEQLRYEGFSRKDAAYAVAAVHANWKEQAAKSAQEYLESQSFSRSSLIEQLEYEGFTHAQAVYGVSKTGL